MGSTQSCILLLNAVDTVVAIALYTELLRKVKVCGYIHNYAKKEADLFKV